MCDLSYHGPRFESSDGDLTLPARDRMTVMPFFAGWLKKNNLSPARIYGFHSTVYGTMEHIEKVRRVQ